MKIIAYFIALLIPFMLISCSTTQDKSDEELADELVSSTFDDVETDEIDDDPFAEEEAVADIEDMDIEFTPDEEVDIVDLDSDYEALPGDLDIEIEEDVETEAAPRRPATVLSPPSYYSSSRVQFPSGQVGYPDYSSARGAQGSYTVKKGDSLWAISRRFGTTVFALSRANNLNPDGILQVGKVLVIPSAGGASYSASAPAGGKTYVVKKGDSYYSIGKKYGLSAQELMAYNGAKSSLLRIGQTIRIP